MKAAIFKGPKQVETGERPKPTVKDPTDVVVRVVRACVCGSDLWYYNGDSPYNEGPIGHEMIGVVEMVGDGVKDFKPGDFVVCPFEFSDNTCVNCKNGITGSCINGGFFPALNGDGGQGEYVRVPLADGSLVKVEGLEFNDANLASLLALSDVMSTGYHAAICARVKQGDTVVVVGDGAVGLCGIIAAKMLGAARVIAMSKYEPRQKLAREFGATDVIAERGDEAIKKVMELTNGIGANAVLECVGSNQSIQTAFDVACPGAMVGTVGIPHDVQVPFEKIFFKNVGVQGGPAPVRAYLPTLLTAVINGHINPGKVFDFVTDLDHIKDAYEKMENHQAIKSILKISEV